MQQNYLFLDDIRNPIDAFSYTKQKMFIDENWDVVRNYEEFKNYIIQNGIPSMISFDHDLADSHYQPEHLWDNYDKSKKWQDQQVHKEKTGYECAKWLIEYCTENNLKLCSYFCHSMNPVGKDNIINALTNFTKCNK
jgi:hypothetical protein